MPLSLSNVRTAREQLCSEYIEETVSKGTTNMLSASCSNEVGVMALLGKWENSTRSGAPKKSNASVALIQTSYASHMNSTAHHTGALQKHMSTIPPSLDMDQQVREHITRVLGMQDIPPNAGHISLNMSIQLTTSGRCLLAHSPVAVTAKNG
ncbi:unnamed protein product [Rodentolepis nana]|uniref:Auxin_canalis domain-containing protein n=1 Tax=Rodentolepis nana TaxID=102285 RepID=A0A0R3TF78_RODNA|nr:unnamed protein product [Rodentolepis nana]